MTINVRLVGSFRIGRFKEESRHYRPGASISEVIESLKLPKQMVGIVLVNGSHADLKTLLQNGDSLTILPLLDGG